MEENPQQPVSEVEQASQTNKPNKKIFIIIGVVLLVLLGGFLVVRNLSSSPEGTEDTESISDLPEADPRIQVNLTPKDPGKTVLLTISDYPDDMTSIEYELTYVTEGDKTEGVFGTIKIDSGQKSIEREITLGTCSSGVCRYHNIQSGQGLLTIKFVARSGASRFQKEFNLL